MKLNLTFKESLLVVTAGFILACSSGPVFPAGFAAMVSPPRFELGGNPGEIIREVVEIQNADDLPATFALRTADWDLNDDGGVKIHSSKLQKNSCRPWARLERHRVRLSGQGTKHYRFEIHIPADAVPGECRLAILVEAGQEEDAVMAKAGNISFPVQGRIAIIVYVTIGDAAPQLKMERLALENVRGQTIPMVRLTNEGNAHGRPAGILEGTDANGEYLEFNVSPSPILPGQTRDIPIWQATIEDERAMVFTPPLKLKGVIEWEGGEQKVDTVLTMPMKTELSTPITKSSSDSESAPAGTSH